MTKCFSRRNKFSKITIEKIYLFLFFSLMLPIAFVSASEFVTVNDGDFYLNGEKWYPYGVNYYSRFLNPLLGFYDEGHSYYSSEYYNSIGKLGVRTRKIGLSRDYHKGMILEHLKKNKIGAMKEFMQVCHELKRSDIRNLLTELKKDNKIRIKSGKTVSSIWELVD